MAERVVARRPVGRYHPATVESFAVSPGASLVILDGDTAAVGAVSIVPGFTPAPGDRVMVSLHPPSQALIVGSIGAVGRPYRAEVWRSAAYNIGTGGVFFEYDTEIVDPANAYAGSTYTCPVKGLYRVSWGVLLNLPVGGTRVLSDLYRNGVSVRRIWDVHQVNNSPLEMPATTEVSCAAGDRLQVFVHPPTAAITINPAGAAFNYATFDLAS